MLEEFIGQAKFKCLKYAKQSYKLDVFSDRASWIDYILITNFDALIIIYS